MKEHDAQPTDLPPVSEDVSGTLLTGLPSLRITFSWALAGNVVYALAQWGVVSVLAKLGTKELVGQFSLVMAVTTPVLLLAALQLRVIQATDASSKYSFGDYLALRIVTTTLAVLIVGGIALLAGYKPEIQLLLLVMGAAKAFESLSDVIYGLLQYRERMDRIAQALMLKGFMSLVAFSVTFYLTKSLLWATCGLAVARLVLLFVFDLRSAAIVLATTPGSLGTPAETVSLRPHWDWPRLWRLTLLAWPLGVVTMLASLQTNIPRYFIEHYLGEGALGVFSAIAYLQVAGTTLVAALAQASSPRLAKYHAADDRRAWSRLVFKLIGLSCVVGTLGVVVALTLGKPILTILYEPEYATQLGVFAWIMVGATLEYATTMLSYAVISATRAFGHYLGPWLAVTAVAALFSLLMIPAYGLQGAAWGVVGTSACKLLATMLILRNVRRAERRAAEPAVAQTP